MKTTVLFDTNAYRNLVAGKSKEQVIAIINKMREKEKLIGFHPSAITFAGMEMVANLYEGPRGHNYHDCLNGLIAMSHHCYNSDAGTFNLLPPPYTQLLRLAFNQTDAAHTQQVKNLGGLLSSFRENPEQASTTYQADGTLQRFRDFFIESEANFAINLDALIKVCKTTIHSEHASANLKHKNDKLASYISNRVPELMILGTLKLISIERNLNIPDTTIKTIAAQINKDYPVSGGFYSYIMKKCVEGNIDLFSDKSREKRWNWMWDYHVCSLIGNATIDGGKALVVTADKDIISVLKQHNLSRHHLKLEDYLSHIG